jgi:tetratricopeptide (TPR) repeat protein
MNQGPPTQSARVAALVSALLLGIAAPFAALRGAALPEPAAHVQENPADLRERAFNLAYNLDHDEAIALLRRGVELAPNDPAAHSGVASVVWLNMLFRRGAVTVDHYLGSFSKARVNLSKPPAELDAEFRRHVERALSLSEQRVAANPRDPQAHYDLGVAAGLRASYIATVEGKLLSGFRAAQRAFDQHEKVMELDPSRVDAGLIVGTYRYVVSTLSLPMRMMAYVVGFGGGRDKAVSLLQATSASRTEVRTDAMFALILVFNREQKYEEALKVIAALRDLYPRNRLVVLEAGSTALRARAFARAEALLNEGLAMTAKDTRQKIPGELALWRYKRGAARAGLGQVEAALEDLRAATGADAQAWVGGRARVEIARLALARGDRAAAANEARQAEALCRQGNDPECVDQAKALERKANGR